MIADSTIPTIQHLVPYTVPVNIAWYFSISLGVATLVRGIIESHGKRLNGIEQGWWTPKEYRNLALFNIVRAVILGIFPLYSSDPTVVTFLLVCAGISLISIALDIIVFNKIQSGQSNDDNDTVAGPTGMLVQLLSDQVVNVRHSSRKAGTAIRAHMKDGAGKDSHDDEQDE